MLKNTSILIGVIIIMLGSACKKEKVVRPPEETVTVGTGEIDFEKWKSAELVWEDNFDGEELDTTKWKHEYMDRPWYNDELQHYTRGENTSIEDGKLIITAKLEGEGQEVGDYTSTRLNSRQTFTYGRKYHILTICRDIGSAIANCIKAFKFYSFCYLILSIYEIRSVDGHIGII